MTNHIYTDQECSDGISRMRGWNTVDDYHSFAKVLTDIASREWNDVDIRTIASMVKDGWGVALDYYFLDIARHPSYILLYGGARSSSPCIHLSDVFTNEMRHRPHARTKK